ncbi:DUF4276 family protein [[Flexibacter] sp. ATCC 35208]|uniref:DUF4276 family protein n=1 Tax=[Flexibacter] sp. ATCC 35208 TaxID=1936242 RepID=UPI0009C6AF63|nr:DUF4276 family protein [[Flexibacter] sp. ATCC 35208]OMP79153.1 hypothetical protein BW716_11075 [[Flexibacter] sp. ATCC 35208]
MKKLIIICEGQTEQMFCEYILKPYLFYKNIEVENPLIIHTGGGIVPWRILKLQIENHYISDNNAFITTFIDYYGLPQGDHNYPDWVLAHYEANKSDTMAILEAGMKNSFTQSIATQFIPYIQLHEFEALVLSDINAFNSYYEPREYNSIDLATLCALDPESVNDGVLTAPSKRLKKIIRGYDKVNDGYELAKLAGLTIIRNRCPRFNNWLNQLENL